MPTFPKTRGLLVLCLPALLTTTTHGQSLAPVTPKEAGFSPTALQQIDVLLDQELVILQGRTDLEVGQLRGVCRQPRLQSVLPLHCRGPRRRSRNSRRSRSAWWWGSLSEARPTQWFA